MKPVVIVAGLPRCGSSLTMQMLAAAGIPCDGDYPGFEGEACHKALHNQFGPWVERMRGKAFKFLDPHHSAGFVAWLPVGSIVFYLRRDPAQQAISQINMALMQMGGVSNRNLRRRYEAQIPKDNKRSIQLFGMTGANIHEISFEALLSRPEPIVGGICGRLAPHFGDLDPFKMLACIQQRSPEATGNMKLEMELIRRSGG